MDNIDHQTSLTSSLEKTACRSYTQNLHFNDELDLKAHGWHVAGTVKDCSQSADPYLFNWVCAHSLHLFIYLLILSSHICYIMTSFPSIQCSMSSPHFSSPPDPFFPCPLTANRIWHNKLREDKAQSLTSKLEETRQSEEKGPKSQRLWSFQLCNCLVAGSSGHGVIWLTTGVSSAWQD